MSGFDGIEGTEHHGGVPTAGQAFTASHGKSQELRGELARRRRPPRRRWWRFWRRSEDTSLDPAAGEGQTPSSS